MTANGDGGRCAAISKFVDAEAIHGARFVEVKLKRRCYKMSPNMRFRT